MDQAWRMKSWLSKPHTTPSAWWLASMPTLGWLHHASPNPLFGCCNSDYPCRWPSPIGFGTFPHIDWWCLVGFCCSVTIEIIVQLPRTYPTFTRQQSSQWLASLAILAEAALGNNSSTGRNPACGTLTTSIVYPQVPSQVWGLRRWWNHGWNLCQLHGSIAQYRDNMFHYVSLGCKLKVSLKRTCSATYAHWAPLPGVTPYVTAQWRLNDGGLAAQVSIFLLNLLIAQLNQSYHDVFEDMQAIQGARIRMHSSPDGDQPLAMSKMQRQNAYGTTNEH